MLKGQPLNDKRKQTNWYPLIILTIPIKFNFISIKFNFISLSLNLIISVIATDKKFIQVEWYLRNF